MAARIAAASVVCGAMLLSGAPVVLACTAFCAVAGDQVLVGNNEDWNNPRTRLWFVPARPGAFGRMYVGFDDLAPQGGMNERGLWFDGFAVPAVKGTGPSNLPHYPGNIIDAAMAECSTVEEVMRLFSRYNRAFLTEGILMFADASGDAVSIERNAMVRKTGRHFVQTNFHQSLPQRGEPDWRFATASTMLHRAGDDISVDLFRRILAATRQKGVFPTLYSNIYDLRSRTMHLYYFHDFERVVTFDLAEELKKGERVLDIPALFPLNPAAEMFAANRREAARTAGPVATIALFAIPGALVVLALVGVVRGGRRLRLGLSVLLGAVAVAVMASAVVLRMHRGAAAEWLEFSIGPASGDSTSIRTSAVKASGITLRVALATAYDVPSVRVIGPPWLDQTRYSLNAVVGVESSDAFRSLLRRELENRLRLDTHLEVRPFDIFVLTATDTPRLERAPGGNRSVWISNHDAQLQEVSMEGVASALQGILGKPVIDETGITGSYNIQLEWDDDRVASVTALLHDRFGLRLAPAKREMEALVIDSIRRDPSLVLLEHIGRVTRGAPSRFREQIAEILSIH